MIYKCTELTYIDNRPVSDRDRVCIVAWAKVTCYDWYDAVGIIHFARVGLKLRGLRERG